MNMTFREEDYQAAALAALALTNVEDERCMVPMKHAAGALVLRELMSRVLRGELVLSGRAPEAPPEQQPPQE